MPDHRTRLMAPCRSPFSGSPERDATSGRILGRWTPRSVTIPVTRSGNVKDGGGRWVGQGETLQNSQNFRSERAQPTDSAQNSVDIFLCW